MRNPPNQINATLEVLMTSEVAGSIRACHRPAASAASDTSATAALNRLRSTASRLNARTTRMPDSCSRITRLMPSIRRCIRRKIGSIECTMYQLASPSAGMLTTRSHDNPAFW
ncbi:Uncharacterised protein [Mycobacteroides abscessus subsp. abscessus]|nr:Uncharacterised protein [Mycobacteroides abscessus subsp. abscessus]